YKMAKDKNIDLEYGLLGENLLIDYNPYSLTPKSQLLIGEVVLEIVQNCTICKSLTKIDNKLPKLLKDDRGVFAKVIKSGLISDGDKIYLKKELAIS
ncbi:MAG TPA: MOSC domain-containing protein, partial [Campylobacterales bacterium]|nr:MOSC domain-containing protein [Campylobacterales bacterium]